MKMISKIRIFGENLFEDRNIRCAGISTFILGFITHAYSYFNATIIHDRREFFMLPVFDSARRAKWMAQYFDALTWFSYLPWLSGLLTLLFLTISVCLIVKILDIKKLTSIIIIAGITVTNISVVGAHFYWPHEILAGLPLACFSAWCWIQREWKISKRFLCEAVFIGLSLASYGAYTSVAPTLVLLVCLTELISGENWKKVLRKGLEYIVAFLTGVAVYYVIQRIYVLIQNVEILSYMGENKLMTGTTISEVISFIATAYEKSIKYYLGFYEDLPKLMPSNVARLLFLFGGVMYICLLTKIWKKIEVESKVLIILLMLVAPLSLGLIYVLSFNNVHFLMVFTYAILYIYIVKIAEFEVVLNKKVIRCFVKCLSIIALFMLGIGCYRNIVVGNIAYMRLENSYLTSQSIANRILTRVESCKDFEGNETIYFKGTINENEYFLTNQDVYYMDYLSHMGPADNAVVHSFTFDDVMYDFFEYIMGFGLPMERYSEDEFSYEEIQNINEMPVFPADGSVFKINDKIIVKLSDEK